MKICFNNNFAVGNFQLFVGKLQLPTPQLLNPRRCQLSRPNTNGVNVTVQLLVCAVHFYVHVLYKPTVYLLMKLFSENLTSVHVFPNYIFFACRLKSASYCLSGTGFMHIYVLFILQQ